LIGPIVSLFDAQLSEDEETLTASIAQTVKEYVTCSFCDVLQIRFLI